MQSHQMKSLLRFHIPWPQLGYSCSTSSSEYLKMTCCHTYRSQPIEHVWEIIATDHTPQRQMEFPNTNIVRNVPKLPNSSVNY